MTRIVSLEIPVKYIELSRTELEGFENLALQALLETHSIGVLPGTGVISELNRIET